MHCLKPQTRTFSELFHSHKINLLVLLCLVTDQNRLSKKSFVINFNQWNPYPFIQSCIPETWKRCPFRVEPPIVGHYRESPPPPMGYQGWVRELSHSGESGWEYALMGALREEVLWILWVKRMGLFVTRQLIWRQKQRLCSAQPQKCINVRISLQPYWQLSNGGVGKRRNSPSLPSPFNLPFLLLSLQLSLNNSIGNVC